jgi:hypothetical protein
MAMEVVTVAIIMHIRYTRIIRSSITMVQWGMDMKVIKLNTRKLEAIKTYFITRNNKVDMLKVVTKIACKEVGTMCIMKGKEKGKVMSRNT